MVHIALPPPDPALGATASPHRLPVGSHLFRVYDPASDHGARGTSFRRPLQLVRGADRACPRRHRAARTTAG